MYGTDYYWKVIARDEFGAERESSNAPWHFTTEVNDAPTEFGLQFPGEEIVFVGIQPALISTHFPDPEVV